MVKGRFGSAVVMHRRMLVGIFTERDVLRAATSGSDLTRSPVARWMTRDPETAGPEVDSRRAAEVMLGRGVSPSAGRRGERSDRHRQPPRSAQPPRSPARAVARHAGRCEIPSRCRWLRRRVLGTFRWGTGRAGQTASRSETTAMPVTRTVFWVAPNVSMLQRTTPRASGPRGPRRRPRQATGSARRAPTTAHPVVSAAATPATAARHLPPWAPSSQWPCRCRPAYRPSPAPSAADAMNVRRPHPPHPQPATDRLSALSYFAREDE